MAEESVSAHTTTDIAEQSSPSDESAQEHEADRLPLPLPYASELFHPQPPAQPPAQPTGTGRLVSSSPASNRVVPPGMALPAAPAASPVVPPVILPGTPAAPPSPPVSSTGRLGAPITRKVPAIIEIPDEAEDDHQPSEIFKAAGVSGIYPKVPSERWVEEEDFWQTHTHIAVTGRQVVPRPKTRPLRPPQRFHPVSRWKSTVILAIVVGLAALACIGAIVIGINGLHLLQSSPASTTPPISTSTPAHK